MKQPTLRWGLAGALLISMTGCLEPAASSDPGSSSGGGYSGGDQANGGMGGSGSGTVSGYGSIIINGIRKFNIDDALLILDGEPLGFSGDDQLPIGISVEYLVKDDDDLGANLSSGNATEVHGWHQIVGPVTAMPSLDPNVIEVLGQKVLFNSSDTHMSPDNGNTSLSFPELNLEQGTVVAVSGFRDSEGNLHATRLARAGGASRWQLIGRTSDLEAALTGNTLSFTIHGQPVSLDTNTVVSGCEEISSSQKVRVTKETATSATFIAGNSLDSVTEIQCLTDGIGLLDAATDVPAGLPVSFTGIVEDRNLVDGKTVLVVDGQHIIVSDETNLLEVAGDVLSLVGDILRGDLLAGSIQDEKIDVDGRLLADGTIHADNVILLSPIVGLLDKVICNPVTGWLIGCEDSLVYTESPLNEELLAQSGSQEAKASISVLGLTPEKLGVELGEVAPTKEFSRHVFAAIENSTSGTEPEQAAKSGMLVASLQ